MNRNILFYLISTIFHCVAGNVSEDARNEYQLMVPTTVSKCEPITIPLCQKLGHGYNKTSMPNAIGHKYQSEAENAMQIYAPLLQLNCSRYLRFFLCSIFTPLCSEHVVGSIPSCRSLCEQVHADCLSAIQQYDISWLDRFNCSNFPEVGKNGLCMQFPKANTTKNVSEKYFEETLCPIDYVVTEESGGAECCCRPRCDRDIFYSRDDKQLVGRWIIAWAILCFLSTMFTLLTFIIDRNRFNYPEQPIIFFVLCYSAIAILYVLHYNMDASSFICRRNSDNVSFVISDGLENPLCTVTFLLHYYLQLAANIWWLILSLAWFLSAAKKWSSEAISNWSSYFHCIAWAVPGFLAVLTLSLHNVSGDELTGLCKISQNSTTFFFIIPNSIILILTCVVSTLTSDALIHVKYELNQSGRSVFKLEKLTTRLVVFQLFYIIPSIIIIICAVYHAYLQQTFTDIGCDRNFGDCARRSDVQIALINIFAQLFIGIMSGMWVWTQKTCHTWLQFILSNNRKNEAFIS